MTSYARLLQFLVLSDRSWGDGILLRVLISIVLYSLLSAAQWLPCWLLPSLKKWRRIGRPGENSPVWPLVGGPQNLIIMFESHTAFHACHHSPGAASVHTTTAKQKRGGIDHVSSCSRLCGPPRTLLPMNAVKVRP